MQTFTPSSRSGFAAGGVFWSMVWMALADLEAIADLLHLGRFIDQKRIFRWILEHKRVALVCTELVNYSIHGLKSSAGVVFALGGTLCNSLVIFMILPIVNRVRGPKWLYGGK